MGRGVPHPVDSVPQSTIHAQPDSLAIEYESARRADAVSPAKRRSILSASGQPEDICALKHVDVLPAAPDFVSKAKGILI